MTVFNSTEYSKSSSNHSRLLRPLAIVSMLVSTELLAASGVLEEVVVSARRVEESIQNAPLTVTAVGQQQLDDGLITEIEDIESLAPNVNIEQVAFYSSAISPFIRGIGTVDVESTFDPAIAVLIDGVYLARLNGSMPSLFDIAQIEILRGPQGTVFGRNSLGGALNIVTRRPSGEFSFKAQATVGEFGQRDTAAYIEFPIIEDKLAAKLSIQQNKFDGYYNLDAREDNLLGDAVREVLPFLSANPNATLLGFPAAGVDLFGTGVSFDTPTPGEFYATQPEQATINDADYGGAESTTFRPTLTFRPNESVEISLLGEFQRDESDPVSQNLSTPGLTCSDNIVNPARSPADGCLPFVLQFRDFGSLAFEDLPLPPAIANLINLDPAGISYVGGVLANLGNFSTPDPQNLDSDAYNLAYNRVGELELETDGLYLEGIFEIGEGTLTVNTGYRETSIFAIFDADNSPVDLFNIVRDEEQEQFTFEARYNGDIGDSTSYVVGFFYLQDEYQLGQEYAGGGIAAFIGGLQTLAQESFVDFSYSAFGKSGQERDSYALYTSFDHYITELLRVSVGGRFSRETKDFYYHENGTCLNSSTSTSDCTPIDQPIGNGEVRSTFAELSETWSNFSPKVSLDYQYSDDVLFYGLVARAFRSGGFNGRAFNSGNLGPFDPEEVTSYELGFKSDLSDAVRLNGAVFYNDYEDLQREAVIGLGAVNVENAASGTIKGAELELQAIPFADTVPGFGINASVGYLSTEYSGYFSDINADGVQEDLSNTEFIRSPRWTASLNLSYSKEFESGELFTQVSANYQDKSWLTVQNLEDAQREGGTIYDLNVGYRMDLESGSALSFTVFGKNVTDEIFQEYAQAVIGFFHIGNLSAPARYGLRVSYEY